MPSALRTCCGDMRIRYTLDECAACRAWIFRPMLHILFIFTESWWPPSCQPPRHAAATGQHLRYGCHRAGRSNVFRSISIGSFHFLPPYCIQLLWCTHEICKLLFCMQLKPYKKHRVGVYRCSTVVRTHHIHRSTNVNWNACYIFSVAWLIVCSTFSLWICY